MQPRKLDRLIKVIPLISKIFVASLAIYLLFYTLNLITVNHIHAIGNLFSWFVSILNKSRPAINFVIDKSWTYLIVPSLKFLWIPILTYTAICLITPSWLWRKVLSFIAICVFIIFIKTSVLTGYHLPNLTFETFSRRDLGQILSYLQSILANSTSIIVYLFGIYLFILWIFPAATWNFLSGSILFVVGMVETVIPTQYLPFGETVDFLVLSALFTYIFLFIHLLARSIQVLTNEVWVIKIHDSIGSFIKNKLARSEPENDTEPV